MNIAILHYHLNRGGVTQVVQSHLRALDSPDAGRRPSRVALLYGGRDQGTDLAGLTVCESFPVSSHKIAGLDYEDGPARGEPLCGAICETLDSLGMTADTTVLHIHNHALGKNASLTRAVSDLARRGYALLLHIHDFAEDFRPDNYRRLADGLDCHDSARLSAELYPQASQIHYAVLNGRDHRTLADAGIESSNLHLLPNAVSPFGPLPDKDEARAKLCDRFGVPSHHQFVLYPVRAIARKNIGEAILWSVLGGDDVSGGVTLAPINPVERKLYDLWKHFVDRFNLRFFFETGRDDGLQFKENLAAADAILTTSVAEGFGLVFLEAWLVGRRLIGRDLPEITGGFVESGMRLDDLYRRMLVPVAWIGEDQFRAVLRDVFEKTQAAFDVRPGNARVDEQLDTLIDDGKVDFAMLGSEHQRRVIQLVHEDAAKREELLQLNPHIKHGLRDANSDHAVGRQNRDVVESMYSLAVSQGRLMRIYDATINSPREATVRELPHGERILARFLDLSRLNPIRLET